MIKDVIMRKMTKGRAQHLYGFANYLAGFFAHYLAPPLNFILRRILNNKLRSLVRCTAPTMPVHEIATSDQVPRS
jgi:hypothetical protein